MLSDADLIELPRQSTYEDVLSRSQYLFRCANCDRLHVFWEGINEWPPTVYAPEGT